MKTATTQHFTGEEAGLKERQDWPRVAPGVMPSLLRVSSPSPAPHLNEIESQRRPLCAAQAEPCGQEVPLCLHLPFIPDACRAGPLTQELLLSPASLTAIGPNPWPMLHTQARVKAAIPKLQCPNPRGAAEMQRPWPHAYRAGPRSTGTQPRS